MSCYLWYVYIIYIDELAIYGLLFVTFSEFKVNLFIHYLLIPYFDNLKLLDVSFSNRCQLSVIGLNQDNHYNLSIHLQIGQVKKNRQF